jgi:hypothetical protein
LTAAFSNKHQINWVLIFNSGVVHYELHKQQNEQVVEVGVSPACKMYADEEVNCD